MRMKGISYSQPFVVLMKSNKHKFSVKIFSDYRLNCFNKFNVGGSPPLDLENLFIIPKMRRTVQTSTVFLPGGNADTGEPSPKGALGCRRGATKGDRLSHLFNAKDTKAKRPQGGCG